MQQLTPEIRAFLKEHEKDDVAQLLLRYAGSPNLPIAWIAHQLRGRQKIREKIPTYYLSDEVLYPPSLNIEQSSSEQTALFKRDWIKTQLPVTNKGADLTGGFGVDTFFISQAFDSWDYTEPSTELLEIARHNHHHLGRSVIRYYNLSAEEYLKTARHLDFIYIDPSRRVHNSKVFTLAECEPDVTELQTNIFQHTEHFLVKTSPLHDLKEGFRLLQGVRNILIVSVGNECKEVLFFCVKAYTGIPRITAVHLNSEDPDFTFEWEEESNAPTEYASAGKFLYEPNSSIMKAGAFRLMGSKYGLKKLHVNTHLYTADEFNENFPGRIFSVIEFIKPEKNMIKEYFPDGKANVLTRNYPLTADALKKKTGLKDGGDNYLIGFRDTRPGLAVANRVR